MPSKPATDYVAAIQASGLTIYDEITIGDPALWIPTEDLEVLLDQGLRGLDVRGLALRTRSKRVKQEVCKVLGYPVPKSFTKTKPRFPGQNFDTYTQKNRNLQVWNEDLSPTRRYVVVDISEDDVVRRVKVVDGQELAKLDTTGTLTQKYQARMDAVAECPQLVSQSDTAVLTPHLTTDPGLSLPDPGADPETGSLLPIAWIFDRLTRLIGEQFDDPGSVQERNRGAELHRLVCSALGYPIYGDTGQFPDVRHQLLEVKLQTSPTIDLGLILPDSTDPLPVPRLGASQPRHCDTRYAVFYGETDGTVVTVTHLVVTTGEDFFDRFRRFEGKVLNKKLQIPLPGDFFDR